MGDEPGIDANRFDRNGTGRQRVDIQCVGREAGLRMEAVEPVVEPARPEHPDPPRGLELVAEVVPQRDEIDEVVRMEMADEDCREVARLELSHEARERALAQIEQDRGRAGADQVGGASRSGSIRVGGTRPQDGQLHECPDRHGREA